MADATNSVESKSANTAGGKVAGNQRGHSTTMVKRSSKQIREGFNESYGSPKGDKSKSPRK